MTQWGLPKTTLSIMGVTTLVVSVVFSYPFLQDWSRSFVLAGFVNGLGVMLAYPSSRLLRRWQRKGLRTECPSRFYLGLILLCLGVAVVWFFPSMEFSKGVFGNGPLNLGRAAACFIGIPVMFTYTLVWAYSYMSFLDGQMIAKAHVEHLDAENKVQDLAALLEQARIQPHFLYNTLSLIRQEISNNSDNALAALDGLADFLRLTTDLTDQPVTLEQEFALTESYLRIHEQRTAGNLKASLRLEPSAKNVTVPPLILQPLAENALKYGRWEKGRQFLLEISAVQREEGTRLTVRNPGALVAPGARKGHGLSSLKSRLISHSPKSTVLLSADGELVVARIELPHPGRTAALAS